MSRDLVIIGKESILLGWTTRSSCTLSCQLKKCSSRKPWRTRKTNTFPRSQHSPRSAQHGGHLLTPVFHRHCSPRQLSLPVPAPARERARGMPHILHRWEEHWSETARTIRHPHYPRRAPRNGGQQRAVVGGRWSLEIAALRGISSMPSSCSPGKTSYQHHFPSLSTINENEFDVVILILAKKKKCECSGS